MKEGIMNNIEDILVSVSKNDVQIPIRVQNRINYTLKNKTIKKHHYFRKIKESYPPDPP